VKYWQRPHFSYSCLRHCCVATASRTGYSRCEDGERGRLVRQQVPQPAAALARPGPRHQGPAAVSAVETFAGGCRGGARTTARAAAALGQGAAFGLRAGDMITLARARPAGVNLYYPVPQPRTVLGVGKTPTFTPTATSSPTRSPPVLQELVDLVEDRLEAESALLPHLVTVAVQRLGLVQQVSFTLQLAFIVDSCRELVIALLGQSVAFFLDHVEPFLQLA